MATNDHQVENLPDIATVTNCLHASERYRNFQILSRQVETCGDWRVWIRLNYRFLTFQTFIFLTFTGTFLIIKHMKLQFYFNLIG